MELVRPPTHCARSDRDHERLDLDGVEEQGLDEPEPDLELRVGYPTSVLDLAHESDPDPDPDMCHDLDVDNPQQEDNVDHLDVESALREELQ